MFSGCSSPSSSVVVIGFSEDVLPSEAIIDEAMLEFFNTYTQPHRHKVLNYSHYENIIVTTSTYSMECMASLTENYLVLATVGSTTYTYDITLHTASYILTHKCRSHHMTTGIHIHSHKDKSETHSSLRYCQIHTDTHPNTWKSTWTHRHSPKPNTLRLTKRVSHSDTQSHTQFTLSVTYREINNELSLCPAHSLIGPYR